MAYIPIVNDRPIAPYVPDYVRCQAPENSEARAKFWRRRAPLGDLEFYLSVCPDIPRDLERSGWTLMRTMQAAFYAGKALTRYRSEVRAWLRAYRQSALPVSYGTPAHTPSLREFMGPGYGEIDKIHAHFRQLDAQRKERVAA